MLQKTVAQEKALQVQCHALTGVSKKDWQKDPNTVTSKLSHQSEPLAPNEQVPQPCGAPSLILLLSTPGFQERLQATDFRRGGECPLALPGRICRETFPSPSMARCRESSGAPLRAGGGRLPGRPGRRSSLPRALGAAGVSVPPFPALEWSPSPSEESRTRLGRRLLGPREEAGEGNSTRSR